MNNKYYHLTIRMDEATKLGCLKFSKEVLNNPKFKSIGIKITVVPEELNSDEISEGITQLVKAVLVGVKHQFKD